MSQTPAASRASDPSGRETSMPVTGMPGAEFTAPLDHIEQRPRDFTPGQEAAVWIACLVIIGGWATSLYFGIEGDIHPAAAAAGMVGSVIAALLILKTAGI